MSLIDEATLNGPAFIELSDGAARLLLRAANYCATHQIELISPSLLRAMFGTPRVADQLVDAGFWEKAGTCWQSLLEQPSASNLGQKQEPPRVRAGRINGQRSAEERARRFGSAQPRSKPEPIPEVTALTSDGAVRSKREPIPEVTPEVTPELTRSNGGPETGVGSPSHTLPLLSLSGSSSFPALSEPFSSLQLSSEGPDPLPARGRKKPKSARWRRVPNDWEPTAEHLQLAVSLNVDLQLEQAKFRDHEFEKSKSDPDATFRNWLRNAKPSQRPLGAQTTERKYASSDDIDSMLGLS